VAGGGGKRPENIIKTKKTRGNGGGKILESTTHGTRRGAKKRNKKIGPTMTNVTGGCLRGGGTKRFLKKKTWCAKMSPTGVALSSPQKGKRKAILRGHARTEKGGWSKDERKEEKEDMLGREWLASSRLKKKTGRRKRMKKREK